MKVTADDVAQLLAQQPPRRVPAHVKAATQRLGAGWIAMIVAIFFVGIGGALSAFFFPWKFSHDLRLAAGGREIPGTILEVGETSMSINDEQVVWYRFAFDLAGEARRTGKCFTTGGQWRAGENVTVRYLPDDPEIACVDGARSTAAGWMGSWIILFPLGGIAMVIIVIRQRGRTLWLLERGKLAEVDILGVDATSTRINYQTVYKVSVAGAALAGGKPVTVRRWRSADVDLVSRHALQKQPAFVLHDPAQPSRLIFPEALLGS